MLAVRVVNMELPSLAVFRKIMTSTKRNEGEGRFKVPGSRFKV
jgi:hypothetical protein